MIGKNTVSFIEYNGDVEGNPAKIIFGIPYPTFEIESLSIYVTEIATDIKTTITSGVDFFTNDLGVNGVDGSLTLLDGGQAWINPINKGLSVDYTISIYFDAEAFQPGGFRNLGNYSPITLENVLDRLTMTIKAINKAVSDVVIQVALNTMNIATNSADIVINAAAIAANILRLDALEEFLYSKTQTLNNASAAIPLVGVSIAEIEHNDLMFEYVAKRGGLTQYGRVLVTNDSPFKQLQVEKLGEAGVTFNVTDTGGVAQLKYSTTNTVAGTIRYKIYKYSL